MADNRQSLSQSEEKIETEIECHCWHPQLRANLAALTLLLIRARGLLTFTAWQLVVGALALLPMALLVEGPFPELTLTHLSGFVYLGLIGTGLAYALWFRGIERLNPAAVSYLGLMSPVVATILGFVFLQQNLSGMQLLGILTIGISIVFGQLSQQSVESL